MDANQNDPAVRLIARIPLAEGEGELLVTPACMLHGETVTKALMASGANMDSMVHEVTDLLAQVDGEEVRTRLHGTSLDGLASFMNAWITTASTESDFIEKVEITDDEIAAAFFGAEPAAVDPAADAADAADVAEPPSARAKTQKPEPVKTEEDRKRKNRRVSSEPGMIRISGPEISSDLSDEEVEQFKRDLWEAIEAATDPDLDDGGAALDALASKVEARLTAIEALEATGEAAGPEEPAPFEDGPAPRPSEPWWKRLFGG